MGKKGTDDRLAADNALLAAIKEALPRLDALKAEVDGHWGAEDLVYRFYHQSFKVYRMQDHTQAMVAVFRELAPGRRLDPWFSAIVEAGTGKAFDYAHNADWPAHTRPIVEAFFHARYFLDMMCRYGHELGEATPMLPSGWAAILCLYGMR